MTGNSNICVICKSYKEEQYNIFECEESPWLDRRLSKVLDVNLTIYKGHNVVICEDCLITFEKIEVLEIIKGDFIAKFRRKMRTVEPDNAVVGFPVPACDVNELPPDWRQATSMRHKMREANVAAKLAAKLAAASSPPVRTIPKSRPKPAVEKPKPKPSSIRALLPKPIVNFPPLECRLELDVSGNRSASMALQPPVKRKRGRPRKYPLPLPPPPASPSPPLPSVLDEALDYCDNLDLSKPYNLRRHKRMIHRQSTALSGRLKSNIWGSLGSRLRTVLESNQSANEVNSQNPDAENLPLISAEPIIINIKTEQDDLPYQDFMNCTVQLGDRVDPDSCSYPLSNDVDKNKIEDNELDIGPLADTKPDVPSECNEPTSKAAANPEPLGDVETPVPLTQSSPAAKDGDSSIIHVDVHVVTDPTDPADAAEGLKYHCTSAGGLRLKFVKDPLLESNEDDDDAKMSEENGKSVESGERNRHTEGFDNLDKKLAISPEKCLNPASQTEATVQQQNSDSASTEKINGAENLTSGSNSVPVKSEDAINVSAPGPSLDASGRSPLKELLASKSFGSASRADAAASNKVVVNRTSFDPTDVGKSNNDSPRDKSDVDSSVTIEKPFSIPCTTDASLIQEAVNGTADHAILPKREAHCTVVQKLTDKLENRLKRKSPSPLSQNRKKIRTDAAETDPSIPSLLSSLDRDENRSIGLETFDATTCDATNATLKISVNMPHMSKSSVNHVKLLGKNEALLSEANQLNKLLMPHEIKIEFSSDEEELCERDAINGAAEIVNTAVQADEDKELQIIKINEKGPTMIHYSQKPKETQRSKSMEDLVHEPIGIVLFDEGLCRNRFEGMLLCGSCTQPVIFTEFASYEMHLSICHQRSLLYKCSACGVQSKSAFSAESHVIQKHCSVRTSTCKTSETSASADNGKKDQSSHSEGNSSKTDPKRHHSGPDKKNAAKNEFHCGICNIVFKSHKECFDHMDIHTNAEALLKSEPLQDEKQ